MSFDFSIFVDQLFSHAYLMGALLSIGLAAASQAGAIVIGFLLALSQSARSRIVRGIGLAYIWFFRAMPALLLLLLLWNGMPQVMDAFRDDWYSPFLAAFIGLALAEGAFMAEIIRSALLSVDEGQSQAARALGMTKPQVMLKVIVPQATRIAIPPTGNEFIGMIKYTALASVISLQELLTTAQMGVATTFRYAEYYAAAAVYYLVIVSVVMLIQQRIERKFAWTSAVRRPSRFGTRTAAPSSTPSQPSSSPSSEVPA